MKQSRRVLFLVWAGFIVGLCARPAGAQLTQITDHLQDGCSLLNPSPSSDASIVVFESTCDFLGTNLDRNREIFRASHTAVEQLTDTVGCTNANPSTGGSTTKAAFDSDCDLTGENADGSVEIFFRDATSTRQVTSGSLCTSELPSVSGVGNTIAFQSNCDLLGANENRSVEVFRATLATTVQLTRDDSTAGCSCLNPSVSENGALTAFESDCDLVGENPTGLSEIFVTTSGGVVTQLTHSTIDACASMSPSINPSGEFVAFESDCDYAGSNEDGSVEIFRVSTSAESVSQLSDDAGDPGCESSSASIDSGGDAVWYTSFCDPTGENGDGSFEVFSSNLNGTIQVTAGESCSSFSVAAVPSASNQGVFVADCDPTGANVDGSQELFEVTLCFCGAPFTRYSESEQPAATDALYVLFAAVGLKACSPCDCDVDGSGSIGAIDALASLRASIGLPAPANCP